MTDRLENNEDVRVSVRLPAMLAEQAAERIGPGKLYRTQSEYIRDLVRRDVTQEAPAQVRPEWLEEAIALHDIEGIKMRKKDIDLLMKFEREGWTDEECRDYIIEKAKSGELFE